MAGPQSQPAHDAVIDDQSVFRAIANCTYDWESWHRPDGKLLWVNAAVERITGYTPQECVEMEDYPLPMVGSEYRSRIELILQDAISGGSGNDVDFQVAHRDGSCRWAAVSWQPMSDQTGRNCGFRASIRDVTERHQLREELRLYNQHLEQLVQERTARIAQLEKQRLRMEKLAALGQMAAGIAHEVNNPLAGIRNAFELFRSNLHPEDENYDLLDLIDGEIDRISSITHQMYQLYRPSQQAPRQFDLRRTLSDVIILIQPLTEKANIQVRWETRDCVPVDGLDSTEVILREGELKQVLLNVLRNAVQACSSAGHVDIAITTRTEDASIRIVDDGQGVPEEIAARMFEPFFSTKSKNREGMGLGLSVSRSLVEAMGGAIRIENRHPRGACATITLPRSIQSDE